jgi:hypothetical protein
MPAVVVCVQQMVERSLERTIRDGKVSEIQRARVAELDQQAGGCVNWGR